MTIDYPFTYDAASERSKHAQDNHFLFMRLEYGVMLLTALIAASDQLLPGAFPNLVYAIMFFILVGFTFWAYFWKYDQVWYQARAVAESIKTLSWRFMMCAEPFGDCDDTERAKTEFITDVSSIYQSQKDILKFSALKIPKKSDVTQSMLDVRSKSLQERVQIYLKSRVEDQFDWYTSKSRTNREKGFFWLLIIVAMYIIAALLIMAGIVRPGEHWSFVSIIILLGSSFLGWTKSKRFGELSTSYALAASEIQTVTNNPPVITTQEELSDFVNETERAFSREHTQWIARKA